MIFRNKKFTLIELIVVIAILAILASIIIPNVSQIKDKAIETRIVAERKNLQTAVDIFTVKLSGELPTDIVPVLGNPQPINFDKLHPKYVREVPMDGIYYWVDSFNEVYTSKIDAPLNLTNTNGTLSWNPVLDASYYNIYEVMNFSGKANYNIKFIDKTISSTYTGLNPDAKYLIQASDNTNQLTAMVDETYTGQEAFNHSSNKNEDSNVNPPINEILKVSNLSATKTISSVSLNWINNHDTTKVNVYRDNSLIAVVNGTSYTDPLLFNNTTYNYSIKAVDSNNVESDESNISVKTDRPDILLSGFISPEATDDNNSTTLKIKSTTDITFDLNGLDLSNYYLYVKAMNNVDPEVASLQILDSNHTPIEFYEYTGTTYANINFGKYDETHRLSLPLNAMYIRMSGSDFEIFDMKFITK